LAPITFTPASGKPRAAHAGRGLSEKSPAKAGRFVLISTHKLILNAIFI
jgi:hypothetical protein